MDEFVYKLKRHSPGVFLGPPHRLVLDLSWANGTKVAQANLDRYSKADSA